MHSAPVPTPYGCLSAGVTDNGSLPHTGERHRSVQHAAHGRDVTIVTRTHAFNYPKLA